MGKLTQALKGKINGTKNRSTILCQGQTKWMNVPMKSGKMLKGGK